MKKKDTVPKGKKKSFFIMTEGQIKRLITNLVVRNKMKKI
jgi:hypothetical protein